MLRDRSLHRCWITYVELAVLTPVVVAVPILGDAPNVIFLIVGGSAVALLALRGRRSLQKVAVVTAYALPCLLGAPWPVHCITAALAWCSWRIFGEGWSPRLRCPAIGSVRVGRGALTLLCGLVCGGVAILLDWVRIVEVGLVLPLAKPGPIVVVLAVAAIAAVNSIAEELFWRQVLLDLGDGGAPVRFDILVFQAVSFGLAHWNGVPGGVVGVVASGFFSILLVIVRVRWSLGLAVVAHFAADLVIFSVIAVFAHYGNSGIFLA